MKETIRRVIPVVGHRPVIRLVSAVRELRRIRTGSPYPLSPPDAEAELPPSSFHAVRFSGCTTEGRVETETGRRRALFGWLHETLARARLDIHPVFPSLPDFAVPFGYPFYAAPRERPKIDAVLKRAGLFGYPWPELPTEIKLTAPEHYENLLVVPFLW
jgi:hypothetical protein